MPRIAAVTSAIAVATVLAVVLTRPAGDSAQASEVILQPTSSTGPDPFTPSTANTSTALPAAAPVAAPTEAGVIRSVSGAEPGLYGGTRKSAACDVEKQVRYMTADASRQNAFASATNIQPSAVPGYLRSLTPVQLRSDTRVTNHGYRKGTSNSYQAVLQSGTAVLVDGRGEPKVRCACGNPLARAVPQRGTPKQTGTTWSGYRPQDVVVVNRAPTVIKIFVIFDAKNKTWVSRHSGDHGRHDRRTKPPSTHWPLPPTKWPWPTTKSPATVSPDTRSPGTKSPGTKSPATQSPGTKSPGTQSPGTKSPGTQSPGTKSPGTSSPGTKSPASKSPQSRPPVTKSPASDSPAPKSPASPASPPPVTKEAGSETPAAPTAETVPSPASPVEPATPDAPVSPVAPVSPDAPRPESVAPEPRVTEPAVPEPPAPPSAVEPPAPNQNEVEPPAPNENQVEPPANENQQ
ncbi:DUF6777 domain-containing protein [Streptomyces sp. NPDC059851]|uniref:DUF6777 domain-containing protein n=1 Tax=Streptomyces sp. NPDC059851 TaxID=3346971 RepID=UPI00364DE7C3